MAGGPAGMNHAARAKILLRAGLRNRCALLKITTLLFVTRRSGESERSGVDRQDPPLKRTTRHHGGSRMRQQVETVRVCAAAQRDKDRARCCRIEGPFVPSPPPRLSAGAPASV